MRDKSTGWSRCKYSWKLQYLNHAVTIPQNQIPYMKGFISDLYLRPSCYECRFKGLERESDITLGDYWGVWDIQPEMDDNRGTSLVLINTEKGRKLFDTISSSLDYCFTSIERAASFNPSIVSSAKLTDKREEFFRRLDTGENVESIISSITKQPLKRRIINKAKSAIKKIIDR